MIHYIPRYSHTNNPDDQGRWARLAIYKRFRVAWINRVEVNGKVRFTASCHFPTMQNDMANEHKVCESFEEAKEFVQDRWEWFTNKIKDN